MLHPLQMAAPDVDFVAANEAASCRFMKMITLPKLRDALRDGRAAWSRCRTRSPSARGCRSSGWSRSRPQRRTSTRTSPALERARIARRESGSTCDLARRRRRPRSSAFEPVDLVGHDELDVARAAVGVEAAAARAARRARRPADEFASTRSALTPRARRRRPRWKCSRERRARSTPVGRDVAGRGRASSIGIGRCAGPRPRRRRRSSRARTPCTSGGTLIVVVDAALAVNRSGQHEDDSRSVPSAPRSAARSGVRRPSVTRARRARGAPAGAPVIRTSLASSITSARTPS